MILYSSVFFSVFLLYFLLLQSFFTQPVDHCQFFKLVLLSKFDKKSLDDSVFFLCFYCIFTHDQTAVVFYLPSRPLSNFEAAIVI